MAEHLLQGKDIPAVHHEVRREGVSQYVGFLASRQLEAGHFHGEVEAIPTVTEQAVPVKVGMDSVM